MSKNETVCMCKKGSCVVLEQELGCLREGGGNCLKYFKKRWDGEVGIGNKNVKIGASWVKVGDSLKKEWAGTFVKTVKSILVLVYTYFRCKQRGYSPLVLRYPPSGWASLSVCVISNQSTVSCQTFKPVKTIWNHQ